ncbi:hypothetical protein C8035_v000782 [Colletotrichum spinosum]|uniref:Uncharacterized protein n=1 Tax=Colletotrichum spinosum TaxID=1347390 RepID=A0A4R8Q1P1_9PEZI|nr:hypothetical protein C8035_v000782 [Colletotrichum spinosum]
MAEPSYPRDELVAEFRHPPEGGWERIAPEFVRFFCLGQNDTGVDLTRHIPYITRKEVSYGNTWMVYERACPVDFTGDLVLSLPTKYALESLFEPEEGRLGNIPPHVCVYAIYPSGHRDGHSIFIDTERGVVILAEWQRKEKGARGEKEVPPTPPPPPEDILTTQARMREKRSDIKFIDDKSLTWTLRCVAVQLDS